MGKVLRILVIVILILSVVSLIFANKLFKKRELLTKRNSVLENAVVKVAKTIESEDAEESAPPTVKKDVSEVTARELINPETQPMLEGYPISLEQQNLPYLDLDNNKMRKQLRSLYAVGADGEYIMDDLTGKPAMQGPGTMTAALETVIDRAKTQQAKLNKTRRELTAMREKMTLAVEEVNTLKSNGRTCKKELKEKDEQMLALQQEKDEAKTRMTKLLREKRELNAELADMRNEVKILNEDKLAIEEDLTTLRDAYEDLKKRYAGMKNQPNTGDSGSSSASAGLPSAGDKGKIIEANDKLKFAILELTDDTIDELIGADRQTRLPQLEMNVRRPGLQSAAGEFVTRIKLRQIVRGKNLIVADILSDWQQTPVEKGDVVFF
ncbi:MAG: hypothetical protein R6V06_09235 [Kiritimatiellia bacterium]